MGVQRFPDQAEIIHTDDDESIASSIWSHSDDSCDLSDSFSESIPAAATTVRVRTNTVSVLISVNDP